MEGVALYEVILFPLFILMRSFRFVHLIVIQSFT